MEWMPMPTRDTMRTLVACWCVLYFILLWWTWHSKRTSGLGIAYVFNLSMVHVVGAFSYCFDYYDPAGGMLTQGGVSLKTTFLGFYVSLIGLSCFVVGFISYSLLFQEKPDKSPPGKYAPEVSSKVAGTMLLFGMLFFMMGPIMRRIPSLASVSTVGAYCAVMGVLLFAREAMRYGETGRLLKWTAASASFPLMTMIFLGFAGYGVTASGACWQFLLRFYRPRLVGLFVFIVVAYFGLSFYIGYMRERNELRDSVWGGKSMSMRLVRLTKMFTTFEFYNPYSQSQLETVDLRMNQNDLVGKAVENLASGRVGYADGGTLYAAAVAFVPRILWPNKPKTGGSGSVVARFTGMTFAVGTSVGVGQVMEFYVNWGLTSVIGGFLLMGLLFAKIDAAAIRYLNRGDVWHFCFWILPGTALLQAGGVMSEVVGSVAGAVVMVQVLDRWFFAKYYSPLYAPGSAVPTHRGSFRGSRVQHS